MNQKQLTSTLVLFLTLAALGSVFQGCAGRPPAPARPAQEQALDRARYSKTPDAREYIYLDSQYRARKYDDVLSRSKNFFKNYAKSPLLDLVHHLRGLAFIGLKQYPLALLSLRKSLELTKSDSLRSMAEYNLAYCYFELGQTDHAMQELDTILPSTLERSDRVKLFILRAKVARLRNDNAGAARDMLSAIKDMTDGGFRGTLDPMLTFLDEVLEPIADVGTLTRLLNDYEGSPATDRLLYRTATRLVANGQRDDARPYFAKIAESYPQSRYYASARENLVRAESQNVIDPKKIGVVLTLSGKFGRVGYKALQGVELALKVFQAHGKDSNPGAVSLVVMDDKGDVDQALASVEQLFFQHHVAAIIGPLSSKLAEPVGRKAQELGVPLITLTQKEAPGGDFVFNAALTPEMQVHELLRYATTAAGARTMAILAPSGKFGEEYVRAFWDEAERDSCSIRGYETYPNDETDFRIYVDRLVGLSESDARAHEVEELKLLRAATPVVKKSKKFERMFDLKPVIDFKAVFIPDEPKTLGQILPTFAYRDVDHVLFLGINTWNNPELITRAGQFAEGAVFVDGFYAGSQVPETRRFIEEYRSTFNMDPGPVEAMAYDAGHILSSLMSGAPVSSRTELQRRIATLQDFPGVAGKISYLNGRLSKRLIFLTVKSGKIEEIAFH